MSPLADPIRHARPLNDFPTNIASRALEDYSMSLTQPYADPESATASRTSFASDEAGMWTASNSLTSSSRSSPSRLPPTSTRRVSTSNAPIVVWYNASSSRPHSPRPSPSCSSRPCYHQSSGEAQGSSLTEISVITFNPYTSQAFSSPTPFTTLHPAPSSDMHTIVSTIAHPTTSGTLSTNTPDNRTSFSRNTAAILGVIFACAALLVLTTILLFFGCRRFRRRRWKDDTSSSFAQPLTSKMGKNTFRSPIDGDEELYPGPYGDILATVQLPAAVGVTDERHSDETMHSLSPQNRPSPALHMQQNDSPAPVAFPAKIDSSNWYGSLGTRVQHTDTPNETTNGPRHHSPHSLLNPPLPIHSLANPPVPWLHRTTPFTGNLASSSHLRDDSSTRIPDGLLHPLLAQKGLSPQGSARSFLDNVDYSRPISGIHLRHDSFTTFTTQGTGEADNGHYR